MMFYLYYSTLARANSILRSNALAQFRRSLRQVPLLSRFLHRGEFRSADLLLPDKSGWVKVESGLAQGIWLHLNLRKERGYWLGLHEVAVQQLLKKLCSPACSFYDIGAHIGFFSLAVARLIGPGGKVFAFEPDPENCLRLKEMAVRNTLQDQVRLVEAAVWSYTRPAGVPFRLGGSRRTLGGILADGIIPVLADGERKLVSTVSLDDFFHQGNPLPDVIKIDVEGGECEVLKGGREVFSRAKPVLICEVHHETAAHWITDWVTANGYDAVWQVPDELFPRLLLGEASEPPRNRC